MYCTCTVLYATWSHRTVRQEISTFNATQSVSKGPYAAQYPNHTNKYQHRRTQNKTYEMCPEETVVFFFFFFCPGCYFPLFQAFYLAFAEGIGKKANARQKGRNSSAYGTLLWQSHTRRLLTMSRLYHQITT